MTHLLVACLLTIATWQPAPASLVGTWIADLNGVTYVRLELRIVDGRLAGALATGDIHVDSTGVVDSAKGAPATLTPISDIEFANGVLSFTRPGLNDPERFHARITGGTTAELTFDLTEDDLADLKDEGIPVPKPIPLRKLP